MTLHAACMCLCMSVSYVCMIVCLCTHERNITCRMPVCTSVELLCVSVIVHVCPCVSGYMYMSMRRLCMSLCVCTHEGDIYYV